MSAESIIGYLMLSQSLNPESITAEFNISESITAESMSGE